MEEKSGILRGYFKKNSFMIDHIEISLKAFEYKLVNAALLQISGVTPKGWKSTHFILPCKQKEFTVLRSPHIDKKSREQFKIKYYKDIIHIFPEENLINSNKLQMFSENIKHIPFSGVQIQMQTLYKSFLD